MMSKIGKISQMEQLPQQQSKSKSHMLFPPNIPQPQPWLPPSKKFMICTSFFWDFYYIPMQRKFFV